MTRISGSSDLTGLPSAASWLWLVVAAALAGCNGHSEWPNPADHLPDWIYDAPFYYEPSPPLEPKAREMDPDGIIPHYFVRRTPVMIKRPDESLPTKTPRLAVYWTNDRGLNWHKAGHFGLEQNFFAFVAPGPGEYGIRFVGPDLPPSRHDELIPPHRVYHVDTTPPEVIVQVQPFKPVYQVGEPVMLSWTVQDAHIDPKATVTIYSLPHRGQPLVLDSNFSLNGTLEVRVPPAAEEGGVRFAVEAVDKAGNLSRGFSVSLRAGQLPPPASQPDIERRAKLFRDPTSPAERPSPPAGRPFRPELPPVELMTPKPPAAVPPSGPPPADADRPASAVPTTPPAAPPMHPADLDVAPSYRPKLYPPAPTTRPDR